MEQQRVKLFQLLSNDGITALSFNSFVERYFSTEERVKFLYDYLISHISPRGNYYYTLTQKDFFKKYACDLFVNSIYCGGSTPTPVTGSTPTPVTGSTPTPVSGDDSANSPNKMDDPGGGGKIYNITGDPYKWRIGKDGGWWAKRDAQTQWNNISGQVNRGDKPNWKISIDTMDRVYFGGDASKRVASKDLNEGADISSKMTLGKFFLD